MRRTDAQLLADADRDAHAFRALYRRHERALLAYAGRQLRDPQLTIDVVAETFARAYTSRHTFSGADDARGWLLGIARHVLIAGWERGRVETEARERLGMETVVVGEASQRSVEETVLAADESSVELWLADLPPDQREAVRRHVLEDAGYEQLAVELQCSQAVVRKRVSRGLSRLRRTLLEER